MTPVFSDDENYRSTNYSPIANSNLCSVTFTSGELARCWTFADEGRLYEMAEGRSSPPPPQVSVDQGKDVERSA